MKANKSNELIKWLFQTGAVKVCPEDKPFWYTSGTIGPYYINTHFLYGSEAKAVCLLDLIDDTVLNRKSDLTGILLKEELSNYKTDLIYHQLIDMLISYIDDYIGRDKIGYIPGGERRDWFFSVIVAYIIGKPHITIFKDCGLLIYGQEGYSGQSGTSKCSNSGESGRISGSGSFESGSIVTDARLEKASILHIADLITEASSYLRTWIPAISKAGGRINRSLVVIDRLQGGRETLENQGIASHALVCAGREMFKDAFDLGIISKDQLDMIFSYIEDPHASMQAFIKNHPGFLADALRADPKTAERASICIKNKIYDEK